MIALLLSAALWLATTPADLTPVQVLDVARATMKAAKNCFLITLDSTGQPQARLMAPFDPESSMNVWLATSRQTRKVEQIRKNSVATLAYHDAAGNGYVTLVGRASLVEDRAERIRRWKPEWRAFYPGGPEGPEFLLIEFRTERIEVMSIDRKVADSPLGWKPAILVRDASGWKLEPTARSNDTLP